MLLPWICHGGGGLFFDFLCVVVVIVVEMDYIILLGNIYYFNELNRK